MGEASEDSASESEPSTDDEGSGDTLGSESERSTDNEDYDSDFVVDDDDVSDSSEDMCETDLSESGSACSRKARKRTRVIVSSDESDDE